MIEEGRRRLGDGLESRRLFLGHLQLLAQVVHLLNERLHVKEAKVVAAVVLRHLLAELHHMQLGEAQPVFLGLGLEREGKHRYKGGG